MRRAAPSARRRWPIAESAWLSSAVPPDLRRADRRSAETRGGARSRSCALVGVSAASPAPSRRPPPVALFLATGGSIGAAAGVSSGRRTRRWACTRRGRHCSARRVDRVAPLGAPPRSVLAGLLGTGGRRVLGAARPRGAALRTLAALAGDDPVALEGVLRDDAVPSDFGVTCTLDVRRVERDGDWVPMTRRRAPDDCRRRRAGGAARVAGRAPGARHGHAAAPVAVSQLRHAGPGTAAGVARHPPVRRREERGAGRGAGARLAARRGHGRGAGVGAADRRGRDRSGRSARGRRSSSRCSSAIAPACRRTSKRACSAPAPTTCWRSRAATSPCSPRSFSRSSAASAWRRGRARSSCSACSRSMPLPSSAAPRSPARRWPRRSTCRRARSTCARRPSTRSRSRSR